jgi:hypothetical protein
LIADKGMTRKPIGYRRILKDADVTTNALPVPPRFDPNTVRSVPPGGGFLIATVASVIMWAVIAGIVAIA